MLCSSHWRKEKRIGGKRRRKHVGCTSGRRLKQSQLRPGANMHGRDLMARFAIRAPTDVKVMCQRLEWISRAIDRKTAHKDPLLTL